MKPFVVLVLLFLMVSSTQFFTGCSTKPTAVGEYDEIRVFCDSLDWPDYRDALNDVFGKYIKTPVLEREFILIWTPYEQFEHHKHFKNLFFLGRLDSDMPVSQNVKALLNEDIIEGIKSGKYFYIPKPNAWASQQYVLFLVGTSREDLIQKIHDYGDVLYRDFRRSYFTRLKEGMFKRMEQKKLEDYLARHFPFTMRVQHDYFIADENLDENYVWIRRLHPDRSILVHWQTVSDTFQLTTRWIIDERNRLAKKVFEGDVVVEEETHAYSVKFRQWPAIRVQGTWRNDKYMIGGPFRTIAFVVPEYHRLYMLDFYVQAIGRRKKPFIDQLDVLVHTIQPLKEPRVEEKEKE